jgi:hypothetical protein
VNISFASTRFSDTDGASLKAWKCAESFTPISHKCFWFSGISDLPEKASMVDPRAFFGRSAIQVINDQIWNVPIIAPAI